MGLIIKILSEQKTNYKIHTINTNDKGLLILSPTRLCTESTAHTRLTSVQQGWCTE